MSAAFGTSHTIASQLLARLLGASELYACTYPGVVSTLRVEPIVHPPPTESRLHAHVSGQGVHHWVRFLACSVAEFVRIREVGRHSTPLPEVSRLRLLVAHAAAHASTPNRDATAVRTLSPRCVHTKKAMSASTPMACGVSHMCGNHIGSRFGAHRRLAPVRTETSVAILPGSIGKCAGTMDSAGDRLLCHDHL